MFMNKSYIITSHFPLDINIGPECDVRHGMVIMNCRKILKSDYAEQHAYTRQTYVQFPPQFGINTITKYSYAEYNARYVGYGTAIILIIPHHKIENSGKISPYGQLLAEKHRVLLRISGKRKEKILINAWRTLKMHITDRAINRSKI